MSSSPVSFNSIRDTVKMHEPPRQTSSVSGMSYLPRVDSSILGTETLEQREKFTVIFYFVVHGFSVVFAFPIVKIRNQIKE